MKQLILIIDPQNDFCNKKGSMYVPNGEEMIKAITNYIKYNNDEYTDLLISMDSHTDEHISFTSNWIDSQGKTPKPYTTITSKDIGVGGYHFWQGNKEGNWDIAYIKALEDQGREHIVYPIHCIVNTWGWKIHPVLKEYLIHTVRDADVDIYLKGTNILTEQQSIFSPFISLSDYSDTNINMCLLNELSIKYDRIFIAGFCAEYCVKETIKDIIKLMPKLLWKVKLKVDLIGCCQEFNILKDKTYLEAIKLGMNLEP